MRQVAVLTMTALLTVCAYTPASCAEYFLSPGGDDEGEGTRAAPWRTLEKASETARAGDTFTMLPGDYPGVLRPVNSGAADAPITFRAEPRRSARLLGPEGGGMTIVLEDLAHVRLEGLHVEPGGPDIGWLAIRGCSHVVVDDCRMQKTSGRTPAATISNCEDIAVLNSVFREQLGGINMFIVGNTTRLLFEGNAISRAGHCPLQFYPDRSNSFFVVRGNVFHAAWGRNFALREVEHMLFEQNVVTNAFNSGWSGSSYAKFWPTPGIFRFNRVFHNHGGALNCTSAEHARYYHNVFDANAHDGHLINGSDEALNDVLFMNNVFSRNDLLGTGTQVRVSRAAESVRIVGNAIFADRPGREGTVSAFGMNLGVEEADTLEGFAGNLDVAPGFVNPEIYDHALVPESPLLDAAQPLATAIGDGAGTRLPVSDPWSFYDGYGIAGEVGDLIAVGESTQRARVVEVDHDAGVLVLDREVRWTDGAPVSFPWSGAAPDIGAFEHGSDGRPAVQVVVRPFEVTPGEEVSILAVIHGAMQPRAVRWWLGDGSVADELQLAHRYVEAGDYPIRVRVTDVSGATWRGTGYVVVSEPVDPTAPLIHSTWGPEDDSAWWLWKSYGYPGPSSYMDVVEGGVRHGPNSRNIPEGYDPPGSGVNYRHLRAPQDGGGIPARIHPAGWDIDLYPEVFVRYRMGTGTPLMVAIKPFGHSALQVAINPATQSGLAEIADHTLHDDGQWHELNFDVRAVRELLPEVRVLEGLYFVRSSREAVKEGHWYDLDEVIIRP